MARRLTTQARRPKPELYRKPVSSEEASVNVHKNAKLISAERALLVRRVLNQRQRLA